MVDGSFEIFGLEYVPLAGAGNFRAAWDSRRRPARYPQIDELDQATLGRMADMFLLSGDIEPAARARFAIFWKRCLAPWTSATD
jgi:hypothetical protein